MPVSPNSQLAFLAFLSAVGLLWAGCAFDSERLDNGTFGYASQDGFTIQGDADDDVSDSQSDTGFSDSEPDVGSDGDSEDGGLSDVADTGDVSGDLLTDDAVEDINGDAGDDAGDAPVDADAGDAPVDADAGDAPVDADVVDDQDGGAANQPPEIDGPESVTYEFGGVANPVGVLLIGDPDAGDADIEVTLEVSDGLLSLVSLSLDLVCGGTGTDDKVMVLCGTVAELNSALGSLSYRVTDRIDADDVIVITVDDLGNTGSGGAQMASLTIVVSLIVPSFDFEVQRGYTTIAADTTTATITTGVDYVAPTGQAFIRIVGTRLSGMGRSASGNEPQPPNEWMVWINNPTNLTTSINFERYSAGSSSRDTVVAWEIIDYQGASDGPNAIVVRQRGEIEEASTPSNDADVSVSAVTVDVDDDSDVVVFVTGQATDTANFNDAEGGFFTASWAADSNQAVFNRRDPEFVAMVSYTVVEFTGSNWSVQRVENAFAAAGVSETQGLDPSVELSRSFIHAQFRTAVGNLDHLGAEIWLSATNAVSFFLQTGAGSPTITHGVAWVVTNAQADAGAMVVQHQGATRTATAATPDSGSLDISSVDLAHASIMGESGRSAGTGDWVPRGSIVMTITDATHVEVRQSNAGQEQNLRFDIVSWPDVQPQTLVPLLSPSL